MKVLLLKQRKQAREGLNLMVTTMKVNLLMDNSKGKANTTLQKLVRFIRENSMRIT